MHLITLSSLFHFSFVNVKRTIYTLHKYKINKSKRMQRIPHAQRNAHALAPTNKPANIHTSCRRLEDLIKQWCTSSPPQLLQLPH